MIMFMQPKTELAFSKAAAIALLSHVQLVISQQHNPKQSCIPLNSPKSKGLERYNSVGCLGSFHMYCCQAISLYVKTFTFITAEIPFVSLGPAFLGCQDCFESWLCLPPY